MKLLCICHILFVQVLTGNKIYVFVYIKGVCDFTSHDHRKVYYNTMHGICDYNE